MPNGLLIDYEFCTGCHSCEVACKEEHGYPVGKWGIHVLKEGPWVIDGKHMNWNFIPAPTDLCDLCADRLADGRKPTCVHHCLAQCMTFGPLEELVAGLAEKPRQVLFVPDPERGAELGKLAVSSDDEVKPYVYDGVTIPNQREEVDEEDDRPDDVEGNESFRVAYMRYDVNNDEKKGSEDWG